MKGIKMYAIIQQMKNQGFSQARTAKELCIHRKTVKRYWNMTADEYEQNCHAVKKISTLAEYRSIIESWIKEHPSISAAQICDWLKESYSIDFKERTVSRYVKGLRIELNLPKTAAPREYTAVSESPPGRQMQVDFGEMWMPHANRKTRIKVRFAAFVLSHSRYKFVYFQSRPFCTTDLVTALRECFKYIGGMPHELVFDQDSIVCVSENCGDVIYTHEFEKFRQECKFNVYMCRPADPESKGKVENAVKYVKHGFLDNRLYPFDDETLNYCGKEWLERTANAKIHGTTRKIPVEVFKEEREHLLPIPIEADAFKAQILRTVRKDNTILYNCNRYSLPVGTYPNNQEVEIEAADNVLKIYTVFHEYICEHNISQAKGVLIKNTNHDRDTNIAVDKLQENLNKLLDYKACTFLAGIRAEKPRYARDQFKLLQTLLDKYGKEKVIAAAAFCTESKLFSANYAKDFLSYSEQPIPKQVHFVANKIPVDKPVYHITAEKRSLDVYAKAGDM